MLYWYRTTLGNSQCILVVAAGIFFFFWGRKKATKRPPKTPNNQKKKHPQVDKFPTVCLQGVFDIRISSLEGKPMRENHNGEDGDYTKQCRKQMKWKWNSKDQKTCDVSSESPKKKKTHAGFPSWISRRFTFASQHSITGYFSFLFWLTNRGSFVRMFLEILLCEWSGCFLQSDSSTINGQK